MFDPWGRQAPVATGFRLHPEALHALDQLLHVLRAGGIGTSRVEMIEAWIAIGPPDLKHTQALLIDYRLWRAQDAAHQVKIPQTLRLKPGALQALDTLTSTLAATDPQVDRTEVLDAWMAKGLPKPEPAAMLLADYRHWRTAGGLNTGPSTPAVDDQTRSSVHAKPLV